MYNTNRDVWHNSKCIICDPQMCHVFQTFRINTTATVEKPSGTYLKNSCHECVKETSDGFY